jgi:hypothetical protein
MLGHLEHTLSNAAALLEWRDRTNRPWAGFLGSSLELAWCPQAGPPHQVDGLLQALLLRCVAQSTLPLIKRIWWRVNWAERLETVGAFSFARAREPSWALLAAMRISACVLLAGLAVAHCFLLPSSRTALRTSRPRHATRLAAEVHDGFVSRRSVLAGTAAVTWAAIASAAAPSRVNAATLEK